VEIKERHDALVGLLRAEARGGLVAFNRLVQLALYAPHLGYYTTSQTRVGKSAGTDFTTAAVLGSMFGELLTAAAQSMVGDTKLYTLVEMAAEPGQAPFASVLGSFAGYQRIGWSDDEVWPERSIVVSNELLDAQPFHRLIFQGGRWQELGVRVDGPELTVEVLPQFSSMEVEAFACSLPKEVSEGWILDISLAAEALLRKIVQAPWQGALIFLDYGKTLAQCLESSPAGTARSYAKHQMSGQLLENLGSQDLTCHVLWDRLLPIVEQAGFRKVSVERQEAFLVKRAGGLMERWATSGDLELTSRLRAFTHPAHFGAKFQVLSGIR
jgi:SAM-dependent MidA family methyltransferase